MDPAACRDSRKERQMKNPQFHIAHIGINAQGEQDAAQIAEKLKAIFVFEYAVGNSSLFSANKAIEIMKKPFRGNHGHIAIGTGDIEQAIEHFRSSGIAFAEETAVIKDGKLKAIYLEEEIAGFALHLVQVD